MAAPEGLDSGLVAPAHLVIVHEELLLDLGPTSPQSVLWGCLRRSRFFRGFSLRTSLDRYSSLRHRGSADRCLPARRGQAPEVERVQCSATPAANFREIEKR